MSVTRTLYEINADLLIAMEKAELAAEENQGEISEILNAHLDALEIEKDLKTGNICRYYKSLLAESEMVKGEVAKLTERARVTENKAKYLKQYLAGFVKEGEKFQDENSKVSWRGSEKLIIKDEGSVPDEHWVISKSVNKMGIKRLIKEGKEFDFAYIQKNQNIQIK